MAQHLELMMASLHDVIPEEETAAPETAKPVQDDPQPEEEQGTKHEKAAEPAETGAREEQPKAPEGLMFFRHDRKQNGAQA